MPPIAVHPAVACAREAIASGHEVQLVAALVRDDVVAVVMEGEEGRYVSLVERREGAWRAPEYLAGQRVSAAPRTTYTEPYDPLPQLTCTASMWPDAAGQQPSSAWFALLAVAGLDAVTVVTSSQLDECHEPIGPEGLVLHVLRVPTGTWPEITVTTLDGRLLPVHRDKRAYNAV